MPNWLVFIIIFNMTDFNSINNNYIRPLSQIKAGIVNNVQDNQNTTNQTPEQKQQHLQTEAKTINPSLMYDFKMAKMDNEVLLKYLQNLLNLPNSIDKFVSDLNSKNNNSQILQILIQNLISTKALSEFLNQNSTQAIEKLLQTISASLKSGINDVSQLKEVLAILTNIQTNSNINSNTLKELILLYIPLNQQIFETQGKFQEEEELKEEIKNAKLSILFETKTYSNILCCLNETEGNILADIYTIDSFDKIEFERIIKALSKEAGINSLIEFKDKKTTISKNDKQNFKIISDGFISPNLLIFAHMVTKTILKIDENNFT